MNKIKQVAISFIVLIVISVISSSQIIPDEVNYYEQWQKAEAFAKKGQPKSAIKIIDDIYKRAKEDNNLPQVIKSLIYRISLQSSYEEDHVINSIATFKDELSNASVPEKQILQSLIAELYLSYYNTNRWKINQRQNLSDDNNEDVSTWGAVRLNKTIEQYYKASLVNETELTQIPLGAALWFYRRGVGFYYQLRY